MLCTVDLGWLIILAAYALALPLPSGAIIMITVWLTGGLRD